ncbi:Hypothetical protein BCD_1401 (plasmid) [Borrelia crocidurae DOU]|uniref:Lipoprotein n=1 Tax=Borrelia crocidurae DOU TaxID=1293575 RepID=W5SKN1_9SPIR|nr:Hypothetical protein BCD_1401 [Borrelia crocidurae DOU]
MLISKMFKIIFAFNLLILSLMLSCKERQDSQNEITDEQIDESEFSEGFKTPEEAYLGLQTSLNKLKEFYYYRSEKFDKAQFTSLFRQILIEQNCHPKYCDITNFENKVYISFRFDITIIKQLKLIFEKLLLIPAEQGETHYVGGTLKSLKIFADIIHGVINENGKILSNDNLVSIKNSNDIGGIVSIKNYIDDMYLEMDKFLKLFENMITELIKLDTIEDIRKKMNPLYMLAHGLAHTEADNTNPFFVIFSDITNLSNKIEDRIVDLILFMDN